MILIVSVGENTVFTYQFFNQAALKKTHLTQDDLGKTFSETHNPHAAKLLNEQYKQVLLTQEATTYKDLHTTPSGEPYYSETTLTPLFGEDGNCNFIIALTTDITNERLAREASNEAWEQLKKSRSRYRSLYDNNADAIFSLDLNGRILAGNSVVEQLTGYRLADLVDQGLSEHILSKDCELVRVYFQLALEGVSHDFRTKFIGASGKPFGILIHFAPVEVKNEIVGVYATLRDMRELDQMIAQYVESENRFRIIAENAHDVIVLMDHQGEPLYVSPSSKRVYGVDPEEYMGTPPFDAVHPDNVPELKKAFSMAIEEAKTYILEVQLKHKTKGWIWTEIQGTPVFDDQGQFVHMLTITQDITLYKEKENQLHHYAYHDSLTGLSNRRFLKDRILEELCSPQDENDMLAVIMLDIDHFKTINDEFGHETGDAVIAEFGKRLQASIQSHDVAARLGGDEFVLLLPEVKTVEQAVSIAQSVKLAMNMPWDLEDGPVNITASMGIALIKKAGATVSSVLKNADLAMYESKQAGRNTYRISRF
ncbi:sensor domain-containing diguanylate cyclase [Planococcus sp. ISL-109]|uniref:sensor domain-containing protein n=1 Tax=Planococcus sp. ISL-109 TaxID=2819166 RepID=UPI001BE717D9|nr:sensor domain-containing diguanylate cyclase [Planococcus sp. ISL-109]